MIKKMISLVVVMLVVVSVSTAFADLKEDVYSELKCCDCGKPFTPCSCAHATEIKAYLDGLLEAGFNKEQVLTKTARRFSLEVIKDPALKKTIEQKLEAQAGKDRPKIFIRPLHSDLGKVSKRKGVLELKVKLQNKGKSPLKITNLKTTCDCTTVRLKTKSHTSSAFSTEGTKAGWQADLAPGEKATLIIVTDLSHAHLNLGHMVRTVEVRSNDPVHSLRKVEFEAEIVE